MFLVGMNEKGIGRINDPLLHSYIIGKSGMGKSTLLWNILYTAALLNWGIVLLDGGGDLADNLIGSMPTKRRKDVRVINREVALGYNPLDMPYSNHVIINNFKSALNKLTEASGISQPITAMMSRIIDEILDAMLREGVTDILELEKRLCRYKGNSEQKASALRIVDRLALVTHNPMMMKIMRRKNELHLKEVAQKRQIILVDSRTMTSREFAFLGNLISQEMSYYIRSQKLSEYQPLIFVVDEFQTVLSSDFTDLFAQARKCNVAVILAHQNMSQGVSKRLFESILGTAGNIICFRLGGPDATRIAIEFTDKSMEDFRDIEKYHCLARIENTDFYVKTLSSPVFKESVKREIMDRLAGKADPIIETVKADYMRVGYFVKD